MQGYQFIFDYPASQAALARINANDSRVAERFELFADGLEIANGFSELTDARQQRLRFEQELPGLVERQGYLEQLLDTFATEANEGAKHA